MRIEGSQELGNLAIACHAMHALFGTQQHRRTRREVFPILSRIQNIGFEQDLNARTVERYRENHRTPWVARDAESRQFALK